MAAVVAVFACISGVVVVKAVTAAKITRDEI